MWFFFSFLVIEVTCGEYGTEYVEEMVSLVENGKCYNWTRQPLIKSGSKISLNSICNFEEEINFKHLRLKSTSWQQFVILYNRRTVQMWRDTVSVVWRNGKK